MTAHPREFEYWTPEPVWKGETAFVLASGPSLTPEIVEKVRGRRTTVINSTCMLAPFADVLFFTDSGWYEPRREIVANWPGLVVCMSRTAKRELPDKVKRVKGIWDPQNPYAPFPPLGSPHIRQGISSGHTGVSLSLSFGASRIILLGFDMRVVNGRDHHHDEYSDAHCPQKYSDQFAPAFAGWSAAAKAVGVEILNCTPGSAVTEFPFADLDEVLSCDPS